MATSVQRSVARSILLAAVGVLLSVGRVDAGNVRLVWDPAFGPAYPNLGFAGEGHLQFDPDCVANTGNNIAIPIVATNCDTDTIYFSDVTLTLYPLVPGTPLTPIPFVPPLLTGLDNPINDISVVSGVPENKIAGINTDIFGPQSAPAVDGFPGGDVWLQFVTSFEEGIPVTDAFMFVASDSGTFQCPDGDGSTSCIRSGAARVSIPEPGSIALLLAALGAAGMLGRRRRSPLAV